MKDCWSNGGCRNLEIKCIDCGRILSTCVFNKPEEYPEPCECDECDNAFHRMIAELENLEKFKEKK